MANNGCAFSPFFLAFYISRRADGPKSFIDKHLGLRGSPKNTLSMLVIPPPLCYHVHMKQQQIKPSTLLLAAPDILLGGVMLACILAGGWFILQEIAFLFSV